MPDTAFGYDAGTGLPVTTSSSEGTLGTGYDSWGRVVSTTDATGNASATAYDVASRPAWVTVSDGKGAYSYRYDSGWDGYSGPAEHRGLRTGQGSGLPGGLPGSCLVNYDAAGRLVTSAYKSSGGDVLAGFSQDFSAGSRVRAKTISPLPRARRWGRP